MAANTTTTIKLNTGAQMPLLGLGTWKSPHEEVRAAVISAIEAGYRHLDCASAYGNEKSVGEGLADVIARGIVTREQVFVTTKLWVTDTDDVAAALTKSLEALGLSYVDLYLIHWPFALTKGSAFPPPLENRLGYDPARYARVWAEMETEATNGRARAIGVSNFSCKKVAELLKTAMIVPAVNQVGWRWGLLMDELSTPCA